MCLQFIEVVQRVGEQAGSSSAGLDTVREELHDKFNKQGYSDYIVVYLRLVTSGQLQMQHNFYQNFIEGSRTVTEFCRQVWYLNCRKVRILINFNKEAKDKADRIFYCGFVKNYFITKYF